MNELLQLLLTLKTGDRVRIVLQSGSLTGTIEEYRQDVEAIDLSGVQFSGISLPYILTISTYLILELAKI